MNKNLFELGEVVVLQSVLSPELNGDYAITSVQQVENIKVQTWNKLYTGFVYSIGCAGPNGMDSWIEQALRKKHTGCGEDWNIMMKGLKTEIVGVV